MESDGIEIRESKFGKGLFAKKEIEAGKVICKATGKKISFEETLLLKEKEGHTLQIDFDKYILCEALFYIPIILATRIAESTTGLSCLL